MFKPPEQRGEGENLQYTGVTSPATKDPIQQTVEDLSQARLTLKEIEGRRTVPVSPSEAAKVEAEYIEMKNRVDDLDKELTRLKDAKYGTKTTTKPAETVEGFNDPIYRGGDNRSSNY